MVPSMIRVAYILTPITFGGAEKVSLNFLRIVDRNRFDIKPILLVRPWEPEPYFTSEIHRLGYAYYTVPVALKTGGDPLRVLRVACRLYSILKQGNFDLVHTHGYFADICCLPIAKLLGLPSISTCHGFIPNDWKLKIYNLLDTFALRLCKTVIAVSEGIKDELISSGIQGSRIVVIPNAVEVHYGEDKLRIRRQDKRHFLDISPEEFIVGYMGRLSEEKGLILLVEAVAGLRDAAVPVKLLIVGDGSERTALEQLVRAKALENAVIFAGFQADIENWLSAFDVFVLPSLTEGTPMALLEAMAAGVPVIATAVGGVPMVITDGIDGLLVPSGNVEAISEKILCLKDDLELQRRLGRAGFDTVTCNYGTNSWCRAIEGLYCSALDYCAKHVSDLDSFNE